MLNDGNEKPITIAINQTNFYDIISTFYTKRVVDATVLCLIVRLDRAGLKRHAYLRTYS